jgi:hypothetical protein
MATSGSFDFNITRSGIIQAALEECGAIDAGGTVSEEMDTYCARQLNLFLKNNAGAGANLFRLKRTLLLPETDKIKYTLGGSSSDHWVYETDLTETFVNGDQTISGAATAVTVDSTSGMSAGDFLGLELEDGSIQWTTVASVDSSTAFTPNDSWTDDVDDNAIVYFYTNKAPSPMWFDRAWRRTRTNAADSAQGADTPIAIRARADYYRATNKRAEGLPIEIYFDPQRGGPEAYLYPEPEDVGVKIHTISVYQYDDMDTDDDDLACTESWYLVVVLGLARRISNKVGVNKKRREEIKEDYRESELNAFRSDREKATSVYISASNEERGR